MFGPHPDASGDAARHARRPPPKDRFTPTMTEDDGAIFIRDLARKWLDSLI